MIRSVPPAGARPLPPGARQRQASLARGEQDLRRARPRGQHHDVGGDERRGCLELLSARPRQIEGDHPAVVFALDPLDHDAGEQLGPVAAGIAQVHQAMRNIDQVARQNLAAMRQAEQAAQNLNALGAELAGLSAE